MSEKERALASSHKHCPVCGKPIALSETFCSTECEATVTKQRSSQRRMNWIFIGILVVFMLVWFFFISRGATPA